MLINGCFQGQEKGKLACQALIAYATKFQSIPNLLTCKTETCLNTKFCIVNAYFHKDNYHYSCKVNEKKMQADLDANKKSSSFNLYTQLAFYVNDKDNNDVIGELVLFGDSDIAGHIDIIKSKEIQRPSMLLMLLCQINLQQCQEIVEQG